MSKVTIDREILERVVKADASNGASSVDLVDGWKAMEQIRALLAAPRQPEGESEGLEVVATLRVEFDDEEEGIAIETVETHVLCDEGETDLCRLSDAQRTIAELERKVWEWSSAATAEAHRVDELKAERDTLRQQLAERDATIERLEAGITRLQEQSFKMRQQRDKLAGLLRHVRPSVALVFVRWARAAAHLPANTTVESGLLARIDAALAEVNK